MFYLHLTAVSPHYGFSKIGNIKTQVVSHGKPRNCNERWRYLHNFCSRTETTIYCLAFILPSCIHSFIVYNVLSKLYHNYIISYQKSRTGIITLIHFCIEHITRLVIQYRATVTTKKCKRSRARSTGKPFKRVNSGVKLSTYAVWYD